MANRLNDKKSLFELNRIHSKKKSTSEHLFWCSRLSQKEDSIQYLEGPNSTWKDHDRNLGVQLDPKIPIMVQISLWQLPMKLADFTENGEILFL